MPPTTYLKIACERCGGHTEYPSEMAGQSIQCPHCQHSITLPSPFTPPSPIPQSPPVKASTERERTSHKTLHAIILVAAIVVIPVLVVMCGIKVSKESEQRATERIATEQHENQEAIKNHRVLMGMTAAQVRQAWGEPERIIRKVTQREEQQEWIYSRTSLYFVDGVLKSGTKDDGK